jgi:hypothetical protein
MAFVGAVYALSELFKSEEVPSADAWKIWNPLSIVLLVSGTLGAIGGGLILYGYDRRLKRNESDEELVETCKGVWHIAIKALAVPRLKMDMVGVHVWAVRGIKGAQTLERRAKFTLQPDRRETHILWRKGKGAMGIAWAENDPKIASISAVEGRATSEDDFRRLSREERFGLTWPEFKKSKHYRAILAIPLETRPGHVAGCLSVDIQLDGYDEKLATLAGAGQLTNALSTCESVLRGRR